MRALIVLAVVGVCSAFIRDTPEVAAEKARFFQAYQAAQRAAVPQQTHGYVPHQAYNPTPQYQHKWTGPMAATVPAGVNGRVTPVGNTAEVNAARQAFLNAYQAQVRATVGAAPTNQYSQQYQAPTNYNNPTYSGHYQKKWTGPMAATVPAGLPGSSNQVGDTPEVAAAKAAFFNTYQRQAAAAAAPAPVWG